MTANKYRNVRAAVCWEKELSRLARLHGDANIISLPARYISIKKSLEIIKIFLKNRF